MKRRFQGLHEADPSSGNELPEGLFFVRVARAQYRWHPNKPQYLRTTITDEQRREFSHLILIEDTVRRIESAEFLPHSGIRFPQNPCSTCPFVGLCLDKTDLVGTALVRKPGVDLGLFDELSF